MEVVKVDEKYILEYVKDLLNDFRIKKEEISNARYHHNTSYSDAPSIIRYGILSLNDLNKFGIKKYSLTHLHIMGDTSSHINGNDKISLSVMGLTDLYKDEEEFDATGELCVDFLVTSDIKARRDNTNYGNEYIASSLMPDTLRAIDIRILKLIRYIEAEKLNYKFNRECLDKVVSEYNSLKDIALTIKETNIDIPLREMSGDFSLDIDKISDTPKISL